MRPASARDFRDFGQRRQSNAAGIVCGCHWGAHDRLLSRIRGAVYQRGSFSGDRPGPLRAPVLDFSLRRDEALDLILETRISPDAKSAATERSRGTVRIATECASLENIGGVKVRLKGVVPYRVRTSTNYGTGHDEHVEEAKIHAFEAVVRSDVDARYTIDWLENLSTRPFVWPDSVDTKIETAHDAQVSAAVTTASRFSKDTGSSRTVAKVVVAGTDVYVCALRRRENDDLVKPGCIIFAGTPDDEFRKRVRTAVSFALGVYLVDFGRAVYSKDWEIISLTSCSAYSIEWKALDLVVLPPAPMGMHWQHEIDRVPFAAGERRFSKL